MTRVDAVPDRVLESPSTSATLAPPQGPVEARSLSSITAIASNPPTYPRNPTHDKHEPLALYIVRVPGSKDVFLSPLKPPTKASVSAEAINSSLYYLHVASPDDDVLLQEVEEEREEEEAMLKEATGEGSEPVPVNPELARLNNLKRKPVGGGNANSGPPQQSPAPAPNQSVPSHPLPPEPVPVPEPLDQLGSEAQHTATQADISVPPPLPARPQRRPLPPVPDEEPALEYPVKGPNRWSRLSGYLNDRGLEHLKDKYDTFVSGRSSLDARPDSTQGIPRHIRQGSDDRSQGPSPNRQSYENRPPGGSGFHITLIRRDPTHGIQWNVATMSTPRMDGSPIDIEISTPGYNKFLGQTDRMSLASLGVNLPTDGRPFSLTDLKIHQPESTSSEQQPSGPRKFQRQLCVSKPFNDDPRASTDPFAPRASTDSGSPTKQGFSKLKSGYYTFSSPWNGTCTFATSVNGRSLKCKHMIPTHSAISDPVNQIQNPAITVAEIRFNTPFQAGHLHHQPSPNHISPFTLSQTPSFPLQDPSSPTHQSPPGPTPITSKRQTMAQLLNPNLYTRPRSRSNTSQSQTTTTTSAHHHRPSTSSTSSSADLDDLRGPPEERMDLSLARENAGGGMRGKSAKLGKLIIEDEGIKMLDLVVAACMAVWWKGYYY